MGVLIPEEFIREVRERTDLVQLIGKYVALKKAGNAYKGLCPFHQEKTASFNVNPDRGFFHCFGCNKSGDAIKFIMEIHGASFTESVVQLAEAQGMQVPVRESREGAPRKKGPSRNELIAVHEIAQSFFLQSARNSNEFRDFLKARGLSAEISKQHGLGLAPDAWDGLVSVFKSRRELLKAAEVAGLLVPRKTGDGYYDRFRNRIMFPIHDPSGAVIAYSGRILNKDPEAAKYVNSPESPVYRKGKTLFGLPFARESFRSGGPAIVVEGNVDVVRLHGEGLTNVVAPLGTALTEQQAMILSRFVSEVVLFYDGDSAGEEASMKALPILFAVGVNVRVARPPKGSDPADLAEEGPGVLSKFISEAAPALSYLVDTLRERNGSSEASIGRTVRQSLEVVGAFKEDASALAAAWSVFRLLGLERTVNSTELKKLIVEQRKNPRIRRVSDVQEETQEDSAPSQEIEVRTLTPSERHIGSFLVQEPQFVSRFVDDGGAGLIDAPQLRVLIQTLDEGQELEEQPEVIRSLHAGLLFRDDVSFQAEDREDLFLQLVSALELGVIERRGHRVQVEINAAEKSGKTEILAELLKEKMDLVRRRTELQRSTRMEWSRPGSG
jgi:DNA primase